MIRLKCPKCQRPIELAEAAPGMTVKCGGCQASFKLSAPKPANPAAAPAIRAANAPATKPAAHAQASIRPAQAPARAAPARPAPKEGDFLDALEGGIKPLDDEPVRPDPVDVVDEVDEVDEVEAADEVEEVNESVSSSAAAAADILGKSPSKSPSKSPTKGKPRREAVDALDEVDEVEEVEEDRPRKKKRRDDDVEEVEEVEDEDDRPRKKKKRRDDDDVEEVEEVEEVDEDDDRPRKKKKRRDDDDDDIEEVEEIDDEDDDRPRKKKNRRDEDDDDEDDDRPRRKKDKDRDTGKKGPPLAQEEILMAAIGIFLIVFMAFTPLLPWFYHSTEFGGMKMSGSTSGTEMAKGACYTILGVSLGVAALVGLGLALRASRALDRKLGDDLYCGTLSGGAAWGAFVGLFALGYVIKAFVTAIRSGGSVSTPVGRIEVKGTFVFPHVGLILCLACAIAIAILCSLLIRKKHREPWLLIGGAVGAAGGILMAVFYVKPWSITD